MRRNISSVLVVIVGVILAVDVVLRMAPQEAVAQEDAPAIRKALEQHALQRKEDAPAIRKALEQHALQQERLIYKAATTPSIFTRAAWATDLEIVGNSYYILWSDGSVTNGGTLP